VNDRKVGIVPSRTSNVSTTSSMYQLTETQHIRPIHFTWSKKHQQQYINHRHTMVYYLQGCRSLTMMMFNNHVNHHQNVIIICMHNNMQIIQT